MAIRPKDMVLFDLNTPVLKKIGIRIKRLLFGTMANLLLVIAVIFIALASMLVYFGIPIVLMELFG